MGAKPSSVKPPPDPDPTPSVTTDTSAEIQSERRETKKRAVGTYGRQKTILAGNTTTDNQGKKTILGG